MKKIVTMTLAAAVVLGGTLAINHGYAKEDSQKASQAKELIGIEKAKEVALSKVEGTVESIELEKNFSKTYYEVDIDKDQKDYDIDVDAYTAEILKVDENWDDDDDDDRNLQAAPANQSIITEEEAIEIAKKQVTGEVVEISLDEDDERYEYDLELKTKDGKAEITIDAETKKVTELEMDDHDDDNDDDGDDD
ncbi:hypothetical protein WQ54_27265 [Bacillus sp. SA1-12]|uniref:PepSY domain-containing protein n=1 Tax=Bacillus sp. SA1-12 TaxID=1455638 RepID=UPI0006271DD5|nr:PepSY domain-containing protein [Bacillus sp. SA1-12]KKI89259.1 hypothetical protein WQ54_27265 [Bacillus sp. SA1-12]